MTRPAYLVSEYPAPSHTFIRREVAALRQLGVEVATFSVRKSEALQVIGPGSPDATEAILGRPFWHYLSALLCTALGNPTRFLSVLWLATRHRAPGLRNLIWSLFHFAEAMMLARMLRQHRIDRLHSHFANSGATVGLLAADYAGIPWSLTLHGISETDYPAGVTLGDKLKRADFVACASYYMRAQAMRLCAPDQWTKLHIVRCGLDFSTLPGAVITEGVPPSFVAVGRLSPEKGFHGLLTAFGKVRAAHPTWRLRIVGDGPLRQELEKLAIRLGINQAVEFLGALPERETLAVIAAGDALALSSFLEGLPVVLIEAMALGKPVVASCVAGIPELVEDGVNGFLFPASDWDGLAHAMEAVAADEGLRVAMGREGRRRVEGGFGSDQAARVLARLFGA